MARGDEDCRIVVKPEESSWQYAAFKSGLGLLSNRLQFHHVHDLAICTRVDSSDYLRGQAGAFIVLNYVSSMLIVPAILCYWAVVPAIFIRYARILGGFCSCPDLSSSLLLEASLLPWLQKSSWNSLRVLRLPPQMTSAYKSSCCNWMADTFMQQCSRCKISQFWAWKNAMKYLLYNTLSQLPDLLEMRRKEKANQPPVKCFGEGQWLIWELSQPPGVEEGSLVLPSIQYDGDPIQLALAAIYNGHQPIVGRFE